MSLVYIEVKLAGDRVLPMRLPREELYLNPHLRGKPALRFETIAHEAARHDISVTSADIRGWVMYESPPPDVSQRSGMTRQGRRLRHRADRCCSALALASALLPAQMRNDALDEWIDEIETAASDDQPVIRRAASILLRAVPRLLVTSRLPAHARRKGG